MASPDPSSVGRYRRRVVAAGFLVAVVLAAIGLPLYVRGIERDLEHRVPAELAAAGFDGVTAAFSGQEGTLTCDAPLSDPEDALDAAYAVRGVQVVELDRTCRVAQASSSPSELDAASSTTTTTGTSTPSPATGSVIQTGFDSVLDVVDSTAQLSILSTLVGEAGLTGELGGAGPFTVFAPTDAAFEALDTDVLARLRQDPELLALLLRHHVVPGALEVADLTTGPLDALDGSPLDVDAGAGGVTVGGASVVEADLDAGTSVVHVVDGVLVPDGVTLEPDSIEAIVSATRDADGIVLEGAVASPPQELILIAAARENLSDENVGLGLTVDPESPLTDELTDDLATLIRAMPLNLADGQVAYDGTALYLTGHYIDDAARQVLEAVAAETSAAAELSSRPFATTDDVARLQATLDDLLGEQPIRFGTAGAELTADNAPLLDRLAGAILPYEGLVVTVEGHTDSDGDPEQNQELSEERATAVAQGLVARGLPEAQVLAEGVGEARLVIVDGVEDKDASRRVEVRVALQDG